MCKGFLFCLLCALLLALAAGAPLAEEPGPWYLISEAELRSIEQYKETSEREKQGWLSQASALRIRAEKSEADSSLLNNQLAEARAQGRKLEASFSEYEQDQLIQTSLKNGEIADLKQAAAGKALETEKYKRKADVRLVIIIALLVVIAGYIALKVCRFFMLM